MLVAVVLSFMHAILSNSHSEWVGVNDTKTTLTETQTDETRRDKRSRNKWKPSSETNRLNYAQYRLFMNMCDVRACVCVPALRLNTHSRLLLHASVGYTLSFIIA